MKKYESPEMEIMAFQVEDVVTTSGDPDVLPPTAED